MTNVSLDDPSIKAFAEVTHGKLKSLYLGTDTITDWGLCILLEKSPLLKTLSLRNMNRLFESSEKSFQWIKLLTNLDTLIVDMTNENLHQIKPVLGICSKLTSLTLGATIKYDKPLSMEELKKLFQVDSDKEINCSLKLLDLSQNVDTVLMIEDLKSLPMLKNTDVLYVK